MKIGYAKAIAVAAMFASLFQLAFVVVTFLNGLFVIWKFGSGTDYSLATLWLFGALSVICALVAVWSAASLKAVSSAWAACARYSAITLLIVAMMFFMLLATPGLMFARYCMQCARYRER